MHKKFLENSFCKIVLSIAMLSSCFIGCYETDDKQNLSFSDEVQVKKEPCGNFCRICGDELETTDTDICEPCQEIQDILQLSASETESKASN